MITLLSGIFHLIPLNYGLQILEWIAISPDQVQFSHNFRFLRPLLRYMYKNFDLKKNVYLLLYSKWPSQSDSFKAKIGLKNEPPGAEIFAKMYFNTAHQTKPPAKNGFSQISQPRVGRFSNRFLRWNREIETVVLSTIKGTNGTKKMLWILSTNLKYRLKNPKLRKN